MGMKNEKFTTLLFVLSHLPTAMYISWWNLPLRTMWEETGKGSVNTLFRVQPRSLCLPDSVQPTSCPAAPVILLRVNLKCHLCARYCAGHQRYNV